LEDFVLDLEAWKVVSGLTPDKNKNDFISPNDSLPEKKGGENKGNVSNTFEVKHDTMSNDFLSEKKLNVSNTFEVKHDTMSRFGNTSNFIIDTDGLDKNIVSKFKIDYKNKFLTIKILNVFYNNEKQSAVDKWLSNPLNELRFIEKGVNNCVIRAISFKGLSVVGHESAQYDCNSNERSADIVVLKYTNSCIINDVSIYENSKNLNGKENKYIFDNKKYTLEEMLNGKVKINYSKSKIDNDCSFDPCFYDPVGFFDPSLSYFVNPNDILGKVKPVNFDGVLKNGVDNYNGIPVGC
jgi:hypothetical protein